MSEAYGLPKTAEEAQRLRICIYRLLEQCGAEPDVLALAGSLFDTFPADELIQLMEDHLNSGGFWMPERKQ